MMNPLLLWGVELSPFVLKVQSLLRYRQIPFRRLPDQGGVLENIRVFYNLEQAKRRRQVSRFPQMDPNLDEYPVVPFLSEDGVHFQYDSSAIAHWLDQNGPEGKQLLPESPAMAFLAHLIDEAFDEFGLYMVHHMRWVGSARTTPMGELLAHEFRKLLPPGARQILQKRFPVRQIKRCPYLFSVAPPGFDLGTPPSRTPPAVPGWPETHSILNEAWEQCLLAMEAILLKQPFVLGNRFTVADASIYGQLAMNLVDPEAATRIRQLAPRCYHWLCQIRAGSHASAHGELYLSEELRGLTLWIMQTFVPLMQQNEAAYEDCIRQGETCFNEKAYERGRALYDGELLGRPFRAVVKTFQVRVWREICEHWHQLPPQEQANLQNWLPDSDVFRGKQGEDL